LTPRSGQLHPKSTHSKLQRGKFRDARTDTFSVAATAVWIAPPFTGTKALFAEAAAVGSDGGFTDGLL